MRVEGATGAGDARVASGRPEDPRTAAAVARGRNGDRDAVRFLYERFAGGVHQLAYRMLGDRDDADDLTQTVFLRLLTKLDRYEPRERPFEVWLLRVTRNAALDELRRRRVARAEPVGDLAAPTTDGPGAEASLFTALASLPMSQREVAVLRLVVGLSAAETASRLDRTEASVNNLLLRARATLRRVLTGLGSAPATARSVHDRPPAPTGGGGARPEARGLGSLDVRTPQAPRRSSGPRLLSPRFPHTCQARTDATSVGDSRAGARPARRPSSRRAVGPRTRSPPTHLARAGCARFRPATPLTPTVGALCRPLTPTAATRSSSALVGGRAWCIARTNPAIPAGSAAAVVHPGAMRTGRDPPGSRAAPRGRGPRSDSST